MTARGLRARQQAQAMLFAAFLIVPLEVLLFVAQPNDIGPMFVEPSGGVSSSSCIMERSSGLPADAPCTERSNAGPGAG